MEILNQAERQSTTWLKVKQHLEERIDCLHKELETPQDAEKTAMLRGRIKEIRSLLDKAEPKEIKTKRDISPLQ